MKLAQAAAAAGGKIADTRKTAKPWRGGDRGGATKFNKCRNMAGISGTRLFNASSMDTVRHQIRHCLPVSGSYPHMPQRSRVERALQ